MPSALNNSADGASERLRLARDLHDGIAQDLAAVGYRLDALIAKPSIDQNTRDELRAIRLEIVEITKNFREEIFQLRVSAESDTTQLAIALSLVFTGSGIEVRVTGELPKLLPFIAHHLHKSIDEIALNTLAHSGASLFSLEISFSSETLSITISDNGSGKVNTTSERYGIAGIYERIALCHGSVSITHNQNGTHYLITLPLAVTEADTFR